MASTVEPELTSDLWLDLSGDSPVLKVYVSGEWKAVIQENEE